MDRVKSYLITGVSSGIGLALVHACLAEGHAVYAMGRRPPPDWSSMPGLHFEACDLSRFDRIGPALSSLLAGVNRLDTVVLNAGILGQIADISETPLHELKAVMDLNLWANQVLLESLTKSGVELRQVVGISSGAAVSGHRGWNGYALSKAALNMLMKLYAAEFPKTHFSALAPGMVDTAMQAQVRVLPFDDRFTTMDRLKKAHGTEAMPLPEQMAPHLLASMERLLRRKSGEFHDIHALV